VVLWDVCVLKIPNSYDVLLVQLFSELVMCVSVRIASMCVLPSVECGVAACLWVAYCSQTLRQTFFNCQVMSCCC
jgi:ABC-type spermidine/putrescine transport system permease subunit II